MCTTIATYATSRSTFATSISNTCSIPLKYPKHLTQKLATCAFKHNIYLLLQRKWRLVDAELDAGMELDTTECAEVAGVELVGNTDLDTGYGSGWSAAATGGASLGRGTRRERGQGPYREQGRAVHRVSGRSGWEQRGQGLFHKRAMRAGSVRTGRRNITSITAKIRASLTYQLKP
jgi:hypothetical protein